MRNTIQALLILSGFFWINNALGQNTPSLIGADSSKRAITTAVPFLAITPDARSGAMGDVGVAISPDANATYWNPAKLAFLESDIGFSLSYTPWLGQIVDDMSISYLSGYKKINQEQAIAVSMRYFDLGDIQLTNINGALLNQISPRELAISATYAMQLGEGFSMGLTGRFVHSNLMDGVSVSGGGTGKAGITGGADIAAYYTSDVVMGGNDANLAFGANISNIGAKLTYFTDSTADFIPTNLRLGTAFTTNLDPFNKVTIALDLNKLLVPTPNNSGRSNIGLLSGMAQSFSDAPDGFSEELQEVMVSLGLEYWYNDLFAVRGGYFYEDRQKGNRKFITAGLGLRYQVFGVDFAYLFTQGRTSPLQETLRLTLHFNFDTGNQDSIRDTQEL